MRPVRTVARALLGVIFVSNGARTLMNAEGLVPTAKPVTDPIGRTLEKVHPGLPTEGRALIRLNGVTQLVGGLLMTTGHATRPAAAALAASLVPTTLAGHPFWQADGPEERRNQEIHFVKNLGLLGGLLLAAADTQGRPSLRWRTRHAADRTRRTVRRTARTARREAKLAATAAGVRRLFR